MQVNQISSNNSFKGLHIKVKDIDYLNKYIRPVLNELSKSAEHCDVYIKPTSVDKLIIGNAMFSKPAIQVMVKPLLRERLNPFSSLPKFLKTDISVDDLAKDKTGKRILQTVQQATEDLYTVKI